jgi:orotate phosphoribosyltransferase
MAWKKRQVKLKDLAEGLVKVGALQFGTVTLPDGRDSSYYINLRGITSYPGVYSLIVDSVSEIISTKVPKANAICAVPLNGLAISAPASVGLKLPMVYTRPSRAGEHVIEGEVRPGWKVVVVDDISTSGKTILGATEAVEEEGGEADQAVVLIDRLEGARERLSKKGIALHAVTDVVELADTLFSMELITEDNLRSITKSVGKSRSSR